MFDVSGLSLGEHCEPSQPPLDGPRVVADLQWLHDACHERMMHDTVAWISEVVVYLPSDWVAAHEANAKPSVSQIPTVFSVDSRDLSMGRSLILSRDFPRASFFLSRIRNQNSVTKFLYYWSRYLTCVRDLEEADAESFDKRGSRTHEKDTKELAELLPEMYSDMEELPMQYDAFMKYLLARVESAAGMKSQAFSTMMTAIQMEPRLWPAWQDMVQLLPGAEDLETVRLLEPSSPHAWMSEWFACLALARFQFARPAIARSKQLMARGLAEMPMIVVHMAACSNHVLEHDAALALFAMVRERDPLRLDNMHLYSDSLFCRGERVQLTALTHAFYKTHKYTWQTCCIVGNYYNMRRENEQAIRFFQRALRLNPSAPGLWVLIGHEFLELKNNAAACMSYRKAIEVDPADCRGWYGLGQMYDILKMHTYALYYYQEAHKCKPQDSRMLVALGVIYSKMGRVKDAQKCFSLAYKYGDVEGNALWHLAKLFEGEGLADQAARTFETYLSIYDDIKDIDDNIAYVIQYLAKHFCEKGDWTKATTYAQRCLENENVSEEGRAILRLITVRKDNVLGKEAKTPLARPNQSLDESGATDMAISDADEDVSFG